mmetsp:Transcript_15452/g.42851  ORF Transcript_15452/g.42851 Transcript_15452/m.42851 type:complete len:660 (-) Transcript_15452:742-2721(-)
MYVCVCVYIGVCSIPTLMKIATTAPYSTPAALPSISPSMSPCGVASTRVCICVCVRRSRHLLRLAVNVPSPQQDFSAGDPHHGPVVGGGTTTVEGLQSLDRPLVGLLVVVPKLRDQHGAVGHVVIDVRGRHGLARLPDQRGARVGKIGASTRIGIIIIMVIDLIIDLIIIAIGILAIGIADRARLGVCVRESRVREVQLGDGDGPTPGVGLRLQVVESDPAALVVGDRALFVVAVVFFLFLFLFFSFFFVIRPRQHHVPGTNKATEIVHVSVGVVVVVESVGEPQNLGNAQGALEDRLQIQTAQVGIPILVEEALGRGQQRALSVRVDRSALQNQRDVEAACNGQGAGQTAVVVVVVVVLVLVVAIAIAIVDLSHTSSFGTNRPGDRLVPGAGPVGSLLRAAVGIEIPVQADQFPGGGGGGGSSIVIVIVVRIGLARTFARTCRRRRHGAHHKGRSRVPGPRIVAGTDGDPDWHGFLVFDFVFDFVLVFYLALALDFVLALCCMQRFPLLADQGCHPFAVGCVAAQQHDGFPPFRGNGQRQSQDFLRGLVDAKGVGIVGKQNQAGRMGLPLGGHAIRVGAVAVAMADAVAVATTEAGQNGGEIGSGRQAVDGVCVLVLAVHGNHWICGHGISDKRMVLECGSEIQSTSTVRTCTRTCSS